MSNISCKVINNFSRYTIDLDGEVFDTSTSKYRKSWIGKNGYKAIDLFNDHGEYKKQYIHRLIGLAFIPIIDGKDIINHKDLNKLNNSIHNLEWCTQAENMQHASINNARHYSRMFSEEQYREYVNLLISNKVRTITELAETLDVPIVQLSVHMKEAAENMGILNDYIKTTKSRHADAMKLAGNKRRKEITLQMIDKDTNEVLRTFNNVTEAAKAINGRSGAIANVLSGRCKTGSGYKWKSI